MPSEDEIRALLREGRHAEAAERLERSGEPQRAMALWAEVWMYDRAVAAARAAGDLVAALGFALSARDPASVAALAREISRGDVTDARRATDLLAERGEHLVAAEICAAAGDDVRAAEILQAAAEHGRAAVHLERAGRLRDAGIACEKHLEAEPGDSATAVRLGRILLAFGRAEPAVRAVHRVPPTAPEHSEALRVLVRAFATLGYAHAARDRLSELRRIDPSAPESLLSPPTAEGREEGRWLAGRYRVERLLGGGSVGRVYRAHDALTDRPVAIKVFGASAAGRSGRDAYARFTREARVAAQIEHPNVVRVLEFNEEGPFLVMELCEGTLEDRLDGRVPVPLVKGVALGVLAALDAVHRRGIVHRDVKPANVFFASGVVKLGDFGTAHLLEVGQTQTGGFLGTLAYMAPEQVTGGRVDASTDLYALGLLLYRCLTGTPAFRGTDLVSAQLGERPEPPSSRRPALGTAFDSVIDRAIRKEPSGRFRSAAEMRTAIESLAFEEPTGEAVVPEPGPGEGPAAGGATEARPGAERLVLDMELGDGRAVVRDALLGRSVLRVRFDPGRAEAVRKLVRERSPAVQAVLDADWERGEAFLERIAGPEVDDDEEVAAARRRLAAMGLHVGARARSTIGGPVLVVEDLVAGRRG